MTAEPTPEAFQFSYLPYFPSESIDLRVSRLHLFNFWRHKDAYITDQRLRDRIEEMCRLYFQIDFNPHNETGFRRLDTITIAVIDNNYGFTRLTEDQIHDLDQYTLALAVSSLVRNNQQAANFNSVCVSDHFTTFHQNFDFISTGMSYSSGSYVHNQQVAEIDQTKFIKPEFIPSVILHTYDAKVFGAFANLIDAHSADHQFNFEVLDWVKNAFMNADNYSYASRCVMMATAFEALLTLKDLKNRGFTEGIEALLQADTLAEYDQTGTPTGNTLTRTTKTDANGNVRRYGDGTPIDLTIYGWWAREFYTLRSKIVHTGITNRADFLNHNDEKHLQVSVKVMHACLFRWLEEHGYLTYTRHAEAFGNELERHLDLNHIHREIFAMVR